MTTQPGRHSDPDSSRLSVRVSPDQKRALRQLALDAGCRNLSVYVLKILGDHTQMNTLAASYAAVGSHVDQSGSEVLAP
jgi:hypothetical protein